MEIDSALTAIQTLRSELQDAKLAAVNAILKPLPGESVSAIFDPEDWLRIHSSKPDMKNGSYIKFSQALQKILATSI